MKTKGIANFFEPKTIVHIGATNQQNKPGYFIYRKLVNSGKTIYPVNPKLEKIDDTTVYKTVSDIEDIPDLAIISIPAKPSIVVLEECGKKKITSAIIIAGGFKETGGEGVILEQQLVAISKKYNIRVLGPNTLGIYVPAANYDTIFIDSGYLFAEGGVTFITQSGSVGIESLGMAAKSGFGLRSFVGLGNKCDVDELDALSYYQNDRNTRCIALYLESLSNGRDLLAILEKIHPHTPVIMLKAGCSNEGKKAVESHTGVLAGSDKIVDGALRSRGIIRAMDDEELLDFSKVLSRAPVMKGENVAIITPAGGYGVMLTDYLELEARGQKLKLAKFSSETKKKLSEIVYHFASIENPIDLTASLTNDMYGKVLKILMDAPEVDAVICVAFLAPPGISEDLIEIIAHNRNKTKPILALTLYGQDTDLYLKKFFEHGIVAFSSTKRIIRALSVLRERAIFFPCKQSSDLAINNKKEILQILNSTKEGCLDEYQSKQLLKLAGFSIPQGYYLEPNDTVENLPITFPAVLKICSDKIIHKTEMDGVKVGISNREDLQLELTNMSKRIPDTNFLIEEMVYGELEMIFGSLIDPSFGPCVMVGVGGIWAEVINDVVFRPALISSLEADKMISELQCDQILRGLRGKNYPRDQIIELLAKFSHLVMSFKDHIQQIDLNPVLIAQNKVTIVDAKIFLAKRV